MFGGLQGHHVAPPSPGTSQNLPGLLHSARETAQSRACIFTPLPSTLSPRPAAAAALHYRRWAFPYLGQTDSLRIGGGGGCGEVGVFYCRGTYPHVGGRLVCQPPASCHWQLFTLVCTHRLEEHTLTLSLARCALRCSPGQQPLHDALGLSRAAPGWRITASVLATV